MFCENIPDLRLRVVLVADPLQMGARAPKLRAPLVAAGAYFLQMEERHMAQLPGHPVLASVETSVYIDGVAESGAQIHAQYGFIPFRVQIIFLNIMAEQIVDVPVHKHPDSQAFFQKMAQVHIFQPL